MPLYLFFKDSKSKTKTKTEFFDMTEVLNKNYYQKYIDKNAFCALIQWQLQSNDKRALADCVGVNDRVLAYRHLIRECEWAIKDKAENKARQAEYTEIYLSEILPLIKKLCGVFE